MSRSEATLAQSNFSSPPREVTDREDDDRTEETPDFHSTKARRRYHNRDLSRAFSLNSLLIDDPKASQGQTMQRLPTKLNAMLSNPDIQHIICWLPHGRSWKVLDSHAFMSEVMPFYFEYTNYYSFIRLVNAWGFRRMSRGPSKDSYWHEMFLRGLPHLHSRMRRLTIKDKKEPLAPDEEPDLFEQSQLNPLPPGCVIPFPPRPPKRLWLEEQERLHEQKKESQRCQNIPSPPTVVRESHFAPYPLNQPSSNGLGFVVSRHHDQQRRPPAMLETAGVEPRNRARNVEYRASPLGIEAVHAHGVFSPHPFSVPTEAEALRFQQAGLAATRRAMEAQLEGLRQQEEQLAMAAVAASARDTSINLQRSAKQVTPENQFGRPWLVPLRPPTLPPVRNRFTAPHSGAGVMGSPQRRVHWNGATHQNAKFRLSPTARITALSPIPISGPVMAPSPEYLKARRNSVVLSHPPKIGLINRN